MDGAAATWMTRCLTLSQHLLGRNSVQHHRPQDRADLIAETGDREEQERHPELLCEPERRDRHSPERGSHDDTETLPAHMPQLSR